MKVKKSGFIFYLSYFLLYISLFMGDVYTVDGLVDVARMIRLLSYVFVVLAIFNNKLNVKECLIFVAIFLPAFVYGVYTGDLYWSILVSLIYASKDAHMDKLISMSFWTLFAGTLLVVALYGMGFLPDVLTVRNSAVLNSPDRHSFGFYHSNVLPLLNLYLEIYYIFLKGEKAKTLNIFAFGIIACILKIFCDFRNAFLLSSALSIAFLVQRTVGFGPKIRRLLFVMSKYSVAIMSAFSVMMMFLLLRGGIWDYIDYLFSGRFRTGILKMRRTGLHLINLMSNAEFASDNIRHENGTFFDTLILDNGYLYMILRYGILIILFYFIVSAMLTRRAKNNVYLLISLLAAFSANFIDNDLADYSFLPFILYAFNDVKIFAKYKNVQPKDRVI